MTKKLANPKPKICITINPAKAALTAKAAEWLHDAKTANDADGKRSTTRSVATPKTNNIFARDLYQPGAGAYYRNDGNKHIKTRGIEA